MFELFTNMMKEEWRLHSTLFGSLGFALFPVLIFAISFMGTFLLPVFREVVPTGDLAFLTNASFLLLGVMVGAFGLLGNEVMNRRFGQASLLAFSARSLPLSERFIFTNFVIKDILYYCILWIFPFIAGFALATPFIGVPLTYALIAFLTLALSFLLGLSFVFFLSTLYARSKWLFLAVFVLLIGTGGIAYRVFGEGIITLSSMTLITTFSWTGALAAGLVIFLLFFISILLFTAEYADSTKHFRNTLVPLSNMLSLFPFPALVAKDLIDLHRSGSDIGQTIFSLLLPLAIIWFFLSVLALFIPPLSVLFLFATIAGVISATMYTWLTAYDPFGVYSPLPVSVSTVIISKICSFSVLQMIPAALIILITGLTGEVLYLLPVLVLWGSVSFYALSVTVNLTGLSPHLLVYDAKVLLLYLIAVGIPVLFMSALSFLNPSYAMIALFLILPALYLMKQGIRKWEMRDHPAF